MEPHADPSRTYATHQYLRISRHVRGGDPEMLRRIGSQQGDATATIQHGTDRLAIDQTGTRTVPASHLDCHRGSRPNPGKVHGSAARGMPKPEATMRQIQLDIIVAQHICPDQRADARYVSFCQPLLKVRAPELHIGIDVGVAGGPADTGQLRSRALTMGQQKSSHRRCRKHRALRAGVDRQPGIGTVHASLHLDAVVQVLPAGQRLSATGKGPRLLSSNQPRSSRRELRTACHVSDAITDT